MKKIIFIIALILWAVTLLSDDGDLCEITVMAAVVATALTMAPKKMLEDLFKQQ